MNDRRSAPLKITLLFLLAGGLWISFSDVLLARYVHDPAIAVRFSIYKGWGFMFLSSGILYWLLCRYMAALWQSEKALVQRNKDLTSIEENLRFSHQEFVSLVNSIEGIVWECEGSSLRFTFVSQKAERMIGYPVSLWLSEPDFWREHIHPDDRDRALAELSTAVREQQGTWIEHRFVTATGGTVWVRNNITVSVHEGGIVTLRGVMYDITPQKSVQEDLNRLNLDLEQRVVKRTAQLKNANQELQAVFQALPDVFLRIAKNGEILDCKVASVIDTFTANGDVIGRNIREMLPVRAVEQLEEDLRMISASKGLSSFEYVGPGAEGEKFYEARLLPFKEEEIIVLIRNITERKRAEQEIRMLNEDLQRRACQLQLINSELESFSYSVSHDLRTPLRHIEGFSKALQEDCSALLDVDGKMYVQRVRVAAQRMGQLIDDMLKLANVTSSTLIRQTVNLSALAWGIATELQQSQPERKARFQIAGDVTACGDQRLLRVVLANLLENAWKYTGQREQAEIEFGSMAGRDGTIYFVRDNGAGFDMVYAEKLFSAFQRLHGAEEFEGNGIGLATVQRVIRRHGGKVWGEGEVGKGAAFYFTLGQNESDEIGE